MLTFKTLLSLAIPALLQANSDVTKITVNPSPFKAGSHPQICLTITNPGNTSTAAGTAVVEAIRGGGDGIVIWSGTATFPAISARGEISHSCIAGFRAPDDVDPDSGQQVDVPDVIFRARTNAGAEAAITYHHVCANNTCSYRLQRKPPLPLLTGQPKP